MTDEMPKEQIEEIIRLIDESAADLQDETSELSQTLTGELSNLLDEFHSTLHEIDEESE